MQDVRYAIRWLLSNRLFTISTVITLALAIGATTAIFSVVNAALFPPLPYEDSDRLVEISESKNQITIANYADLLRSVDFFESIAVYKVKAWHFAGEGEPARIPGYSVSSSFLPTLGVQPVLGRNFTIEEDRSGSPFVTLISNEMWHAVFHADPDILGRVVYFDEQPCQIIGVMDADFRFPNFPVKQPQFWTTLGYEKAHPSLTAGRRVSIIGKLKPGIRQLEAQERLNRIAKSFTDQGYIFKITRLNNFSNRHRGVDRSIFLLITIAVLLVLFIACANISNLLLSRAITRNKEIAIRIALGASRRRLFKQLLTESFLLCLLGGIAGFLLTFWLQKSLNIWMSFLFPAAVNFWTGEYPNTINTRVFLFTGCITMMASFITGLAPALHASKTDLHSSLKEGVQSLDTIGSRRYHNFFVVLQVALAFVLLAGAGLMIRSVDRLQKVNLGFDPNFVRMYIPLPSYKYPEPAQWKNFSVELLESISALPGVRNAAVASDLPVDHSERSVGVRTDTQPNLPAEQEPWIYYTSVSPDFFATVGAAILNGRGFLKMEDSSSAGVIVVNQTFARKFWPGQNPIGRRVHLSFEPPLSAEVVGVVRDMKQHLDAETEPEIYVPFGQQPFVWINVIVRGNFNPTTFGTTLRKAVRAIDKTLPIFNIESMRNQIEHSSALRRSTMFLLSFFAIIAVCLSIVGIYSVINYSVSRRTHEIGIRMSLGAERSDVIKMVLRKAALLILTGAGIGMVLSFSLSQTLEAFIYGISKNDPATYIFVSVLLVTVAFIASAIPAIHASKIDPVIALRQE